MGNPAVDLAITGLEAIGVPIPPSMASLVELLLNDGLDVLTEVPRIVGIIEGLGGSAFHVLEEVASGMAVSGPVGYVQHQVDNYTAPYIGKAQEIKHGKQRLTDLHRANLQSAKNQVTALYSQNPGTGTGSVTAYSGPAADTMMASFNTVLTQTDSLLNAMDQSQQIDADLQTDLENIVKTIIVLVIIDLIVFAIVFIVVFVGVALGLLVPAVALAPETGGLSLPADPAVAGTAAFAAATAITGGLVGAEVVGVFALFLYAFGRWSVRHVMLSISISWHPGATTLPMSKGGQGNVAHTGIENEARGLISSGKAKTMCGALTLLEIAAKKRKDTAKLEQIRATQKSKRYNCKGRGGHKGQG